MATLPESLDFFWRSCFADINPERVSDDDMTMFLLGAVTMLDLFFDVDLSAENPCLRKARDPENAPLVATVLTLGLTEYFERE